MALCSIQNRNVSDEEVPRPIDEIFAASENYGKSLNLYRDMLLRSLRIYSSTVKQAYFLAYFWLVENLWKVT